MKKTVLAIIFISTVILIAMQASAQRCYVSPGFDRPLQPDSDCDGVIDRDDNCVFISNELQRDADNNDIGDACDLTITSMGTAPSNFVFTSRAFNLNVNVENNREYNIRNARVNARIPELGIETVQHIDNLETCTSRTVEFMLRAPHCAPRGSYKIVTEVTYMNAFGNYESTTAVSSINVEPDPNCELLLGGNQTFGNTFVEVMEIQDVYKGDEAVFPIKISNREGAAKEYVMQVTGLDGWGASRISPGSIVIVPSMSDRIADLYISASPDVAPGERVFVLTIKSDDEIQRLLLIANVKEKPEQDMALFWMLVARIVLASIIAMLIIIAAIVGIRKYLAKASKEMPNQYY